MLQNFRKITGFNLEKNGLVIYAILVLVVAYFSYFRFYYSPQAQFWDENYHIASGYKYLNGTFFMEPHPPLGKLFVALGEKWFGKDNRKLDTKYFLSTDYVKKFPKGFKFNGVRFFSAFFAMLSAVVFFFILYYLLLNKNLALIFSTLYLFENANILHSRAAMLEGSQLFFIFLTILVFVMAIRKESGVKLYHYLLLGLFTGLAVSVKLNGLIVILFLGALLIYDFRLLFYNWFIKLKFSVSELIFFIKNLIIKKIVFVGAMLFVFLVVFYIHFAISTNVVKNRYYKASKEYKEILAKGETSNPKYLFVMLRDYFKYIHHYEKGVPKYNPCKKGENGSLPISWIVGKKAINYRWGKTGEYVRYLYLQGNPIIWLSGLLGIIFSISLIVSVLFFDNKIKDKTLFYFITIFLGVYISYMIAIMRIDRVMYLYHYLIPLFLSVILFVLNFIYIFGKQLERKELKLALTLFILLVVAVYAFYSPLTYYQPLNSIEFNKRVWFEFWGLKHV